MDTMARPSLVESYLSITVACTKEFMWVGAVPITLRTTSGGDAFLS